MHEGAVFQSKLNLYADGSLRNILSKYNDVEIRLSSYKNILQLSYSVQNINVGIDFSQNGYCYVIYPSGVSFDEISQSFIEKNYEINFSIEDLLATLQSQLLASTTLSDISEEKKKRYKLIATISMWLSIITVVISVFFCDSFRQSDYS